METYTTQQVADRSGVGIHTVRYYESRGLLPHPKRTGSGYRVFTPEHVVHIRFIKRAQELGFELDEIKELLELRITPGSRNSVRVRAEEKMAHIDARIRDLKRIRHTLGHLVEACDAHGDAESCMVLHALETD